MDFVFRKDLIHRCGVKQVSFVEFDFLVRDRLYALQRDFTGVTQIVYNNDFIAGVEEFDAGVTTNISGAAGHKDFHQFTFRFPSVVIVERSNTFI